MVKTDYLVVNYAKDGNLVFQSENQRYCQIRHLSVYVFVYCLLTV